MRNVIALLLVIGLFSAPTAADQARSGGAAAKPGTGACALLTKELVMKVSGAANKAVFDLPPSEEPVGKGSSCDYADIHLQIDPFSWSTVEAYVKENKNMTAVPDIGDGAYFGYRNSQFAEMMGRVGSRTFTIQMSVPFQSTPEKMKPNVIALAKAIVPKLK